MRKMQLFSRLDGYKKMENRDVRDSERQVFVFLLQLIEKLL